jgi:hypothetical protein
MLGEEAASGRNVLWSMERQPERGGATSPLQIPSLTLGTTTTAIFIYSILWVAPAGIAGMGCPQGQEAESGCRGKETGSGGQQGQIAEFFPSLGLVLSV